ncbi:MAG: hypothetical protein R2744_02535 [Bacteroidales bacterium]
MKNIIYHVDAFIHMAISGNPAGVMICDNLLRLSGAEYCHGDEPLRDCIR